MRKFHFTRREVKEAEDIINGRRLPSVWLAAALAMANSAHKAPVYCAKILASAHQEYGRWADLHAEFGVNPLLLDGVLLDPVSREIMTHDPEHRAAATKALLAFLTEKYGLDEEDEIEALLRRVASLERTVAKLQAGGATPA